MLTIDAHALQHPELHGKKNNAYHLLSLCWLLEHNGSPAIGKTPKWLQQHFSNNISLPQLEPPKKRGEITVVDLSKTFDAKTYQKLAK